MSVYKFGGSGKTQIDTKKFVLINGSSTLTGTLDMGENKISRVIDPADDQDAATKNTFIIRVCLKYKTPLIS